MIVGTMRKWGLVGEAEGQGMMMSALHVPGDYGEDESVYADLEAVGPGGVPVGG